MVITRATDVILHVRFGDGRAEKVARVNRERNFLALPDELLWPCDLHLVLRLFVLFDAKEMMGSSAADAGRNLILAERGFSGNVNFTAKRAGSRERQVLFKQLSVIESFNRHVDNRAFRHLLTVFRPPPQDAFEIDLLAGTINGAVCVDVAGQVVISAVAVRAE